MQRLPVPGGWYADARPSGSWAVLVPDQHIQTSAGTVPLPPGGNVLFLVCAQAGGVLCLAGQGHDDGQAWLWNGAWLALGPTYGTSPCAFGPAGLYVSTPAQQDNLRLFDPLTGTPSTPLTQPLGARGIALADASGIWGQDAWYGNHGLAEYVDVQGLFIGQGANGGCVVAGYGELEPGDVQFVRAHRTGDALAVALWKPVEQMAVIHFLTMADLPTLKPQVEATKPQVPPVPPTKPEPTPVSIPDQTGTVATIRSKYPTPLGDRHPAFLIEVAQATGAKLLKKDSGSHVTLPSGVNVSQDILVFSNGQECFDVLGDAEGKAVPSWQPKGAIAGEYIDVSAAPPPADKPGDVPASGDVAELLSILIADLRTLSAHLGVR